MRGKNILFTVLTFCIMLLASCGGGSATVTPGPGNTTPPAGEEPQTFDQWSADTELGETPRSVRGIPPIPIDTGRDTSAADDNRTVLGKDAIDYSQCAIDGDAMLINQGAIADTNPGGEPAWAMYKVSGLNDFTPLSLNTECMPGGMGQEYSVAVADYTELDWKWFGPTGLPELQANLDDDHTYITNIGNLYFLVVCYDANTAKHLQSTVVAKTATAPVLPGAPGELVASKGEIEGGVGLGWLPGANAGHYEIFRQGQFWRFNDDDPPPPGFEPGFHPEGDEWELLGTTEEVRYFDDTALPGVVFMYKVRSVNDAGASSFSNIDEGWAFDDWEPPFEGIHGYVWGEEWNYWDGEDPPPGNDFEPGDFGPGGDRCPPGPCPGLFPLAGATLTLAIFEDGAGPAIVYTTESDEEGFYRFEGEIQPGGYLLFAELSGWLFFEEYVVQVDGELPPIMQYDFFGVPEGTPPPGGSPEGIHGWVWGDRMIDDGDPGFQPGDDGDPGFMPGIMPLANALVRVIDPDTRDEIARTTTDPEGFYQFLQLPAGFHLLTCELEGWIFEPQEHWFDIPEGELPSMAFDFWGWPPGTDPPPDPEPRPLPEGLSGWVWNAEGGCFDDGDPMGPTPMAGVDITVASDDGTVAYTAVTGEDGFFHIPGIAAGSYIARAAFEGFLFQPPEHLVFFAAEEMHPFQVDFWGYTENEPPPGPEPPPGHPEGISGMVISIAPGNEWGMVPLPGVEITVVGMGDLGITATATTDEDGFFHVPFSDLSWGEFSVMAAKQGYMFEPEEHHVLLHEGQMHAEVEFMGFLIGGGDVPPPPGR